MLRRGGGGESRTPVRKRFPRNFSGRRRLFWESCSPSSLSCRQAVTPTGQVSFIVHGRFKALPAHVHHETTPVPGPWSTRVRRPLFKQRRERYRYRSLIYKLPVFRWSGATARFSHFNIPVETGTPPYRSEPQSLTGLFRRRSSAGYEKALTAPPGNGREGRQKIT